MDAPDLNWYAVRCIFRCGWAASSEPGDPSTYEERITLWRAATPEIAIARAEAEAIDYAGTITEDPDTVVGGFQSYHLVDPPADGSEIF